MPRSRCRASVGVTRINLCRSFVRWPSIPFGCRPFFFPLVTVLHGPLRGPASLVSSNRLTRQCSRPSARPLRPQYSVVLYTSTLSYNPSVCVAFLPSFLPFLQTITCKKRVSPWSDVHRACHTVCIDGGHPLVSVHCACHTFPISFSVTPSPYTKYPASLLSAITIQP